MAQRNYKKSSDARSASFGVWNLTNSMLAVTIILLLVILFAMFPAGAYKLPQQTIGGGGGAGGGGDGNESTQLSFETLPVNPEDDGYNGNQFCQNHGYTKCISILHWIARVYYESTDKTCQGIQYTDVRAELNACNNILWLYSGPVRCDIVGGLEEPQNGDFDTWSASKQVICAR